MSVPTIPQRSGDNGQTCAAHVRPLVGNRSETTARRAGSDSVVAPRGGLKRCEADRNIANNVPAARDVWGEASIACTPGRRQTRRRQADREAEPRCAGRRARTTRRARAASPRAACLSRSARRWIIARVAVFGNSHPSDPLRDSACRGARRRGLATVAASTSIRVWRRHPDGRDPGFLSEMGKV